MYLVIPSYVPLDRLATASGMQMILNGIFLLVGGPLIGENNFSRFIVSQIFGYIEIDTENINMSKLQIKNPYKNNVLTYSYAIFIFSTLLINFHKYCI